MKTPGPDHPIILEAASRRIEALFEGHILADSGSVIVLREAGLAPVFYFPRIDVEMSVLHKTDHTTHCPYKGLASYFTIYRDGQIVENAAWSYQQPYEAMAQIAERIAFYPQHVQIRETAQPAERWRLRPAGRRPSLGGEADVGAPYDGVGAI